MKKLFVLGGVFWSELFRLSPCGRIRKREEKLQLRLCDRESHLVVGKVCAVYFHTTKSSKAPSVLFKYSITEFEPTFSVGLL